MEWYPASCLLPALKVAYSTLARWPTTWLVLGVEALNGITFACAWPAGTLHCSRIAPLGMEATTQVHQPTQAHGCRMIWCRPE